MQIHLYTIIRRVSLLGSLAVVRGYHSCLEHWHHKLEPSCCHTCQAGTREAALTRCLRRWRLAVPREGAQVDQHVVWVLPPACLCSLHSKPAGQSQLLLSGSCSLTKAELLWSLVSCMGWQGGTWTELKQKGLTDLLCGGLSSVLSQHAHKHRQAAVYRSHLRGAWRARWRAGACRAWSQPDAVLLQALCVSAGSRT